MTNLTEEVPTSKEASKGPLTVGFKFEADFKPVGLIAEDFAEDLIFELIDEPTFVVLMPDDTAVDAAAGVFTLFMFLP